MLTAIAAALAVTVAGVAGFMVLRDDAGPDRARRTAQIRVYNVEAGCRARTERVPVCSMGLARNPRLNYDADNVVEHRVWHNDVLNTDCILYDGDRVEDETKVSTTRWYRVHLDDVPGGVAWLPAVRTNDDPKLPTCFKDEK